jgi:hypothetical protein
MNYQSIVEGSTPRAFASLRIVTKFGFCLPVSRRQMVSYATPDLAERSLWLNIALSLNSFNFTILFYHNTNSITI